MTNNELDADPMKSLHRWILMRAGQGLMAAGALLTLAQWTAHSTATGLPPELQSLVAD
ncbi:hypothetical protein ACQCSX_01470 [Pseudarthrobacter sp. P1]|uniref:hypothetical protein n=1 Tax=Pseudarthrobacter sp. P1 TaxID=3418418 RepID=UPI003CEC93D2